MAGLARLDKAGADVYMDGPCSMTTLPPDASNSRGVWVRGTDI